MGWVGCIQKRWQSSVWCCTRKKILRLADVPEDGAHYEMLLRMKEDGSAHRLKGAASTMGAIPVAEATEKLEELLERVSYGGIREAYQELAVRMAELTIELKAFIGESAP